MNSLRVIFARINIFARSNVSERMLGALICLISGYGLIQLYRYIIPSISVVMEQNISVTAFDVSYLIIKRFLLMIFLFVGGIGTFFLRKWAYILVVAIYTIHLYSHVDRLMYGMLSVEGYDFNLTDIFLVIYVMPILFLSYLLTKKDHY